MPSAHTERILVRGVNWLGDAVMTTPALQRLRESRPHAHITLLTHAKLKDLYQNHPSINEIRTFGSKAGPLKIGWRLRRQNYDLGLIFPNSPRSALELWFGGVKKRVGYARPWRDWLLTQPVQSRPDELAMHKRSEIEVQELIRTNNSSPTSYPRTAHHIYQYLHLTTAIGAQPEPVAPKIVVPTENVAKLTAKFNLSSKPGEPALWFGLNAGAEYGPAKRWPEERFTEAAIEIQRRTRCRWLIFGVHADLELSLRITTNIYRANEKLFGVEETGKFPHVFNLAGKTSLGELCAALKLCRVLLTNDSGPMHVAAALGTRVIVPFGSTSPELTGPGLPGDFSHQILRVQAPCSPCFLRQCPIDFRCMTSIPVASTVEAVLRAAR
ncbi:lipopolysaccharide heptosyltransferase II [Pedosphaera parvula]|uniref:lipopolysaccharide heptosyltransferase II n=1 Tax=Pedosphaera parvula (strain Ellin514) TaxID=320771 RepID=B9XQ75_PEDPL|nr:lipopolysaccharide heptosyltransferase II [Pedosphaera parvula]EEF57993.1 lipopolysaccharide heptosyltransferase II [Pedosphaera parvula Ellin514]